MSLLLVSLAALFVGPVLMRLARGAAVQVMDGFVLVAVGGLCLLHLLPEGIAGGGAWALVAAAGGLVLPAAAEKALHGAHRGILALAMLGLAIHAGMDGAALSTSHEHLGMGVALHRLPMGLLIWLAVGRRSTAAGLATLVGVALATLGGYLAGPALLAAAPAMATAIFQALVAGSLLHVVMHDASPEGAHEHEHPKPEPAAHCCHHDAPEDEHHGHDHDAPTGRLAGGYASIGAVLGVGALLLLGEPHAHGGHDHGVFETFVGLSLVTAPALVLAYLIASLLHAFLPPAAQSWLGRGGSTTQAAKGVAFGLPLPICSCGVLPLYESLTKAGVPAAAGVAFLVATPELGLDAILISLPLLGGELTVARVVAAVIVAFVAALLVSRLIAPNPHPISDSAAPHEPAATRLRAGLRYGFGDLVDSTLPWVLIGLVIAAYAAPLLDPARFAGLSSWLQVPLFAVIGVPIYVCAAGATPLAAVLVSKGVSAGAAVAFLLTGPATNATTFGVLTQLHGRRAALGFAIVVAGAAISVGWSIDLLLGPVTIDLPTGHHHESAPWYGVASLAALIALLIASLLRQGPRGMVGQVVHGH